MRKHKIHHIWHTIGGLSLWLLVSAMLISGAVSVFALRQNNITMIRLRDDVYAADKSGGDVEGAMRELRKFVYAHMNTNLRSGSTTTEAPIQLTETYNRVVAAEQARVAALGGNGKVYASAKQKCQSITDSSEQVQCVQQYITENGGYKFQLSLPAKEFYIFDFVSPRWTFDIAGIALLVLFISFLLLISRLIVGKFMKAYLR
jgi:hypothetical protein